MQLTDLLTADRVAVERSPEGDFTKARALSALSKLLAAGTHVPPETIERILVEREQLQSTGIGEGVAIPHGAMSQLESQCAALLIVPGGVEFQAIDGERVTLLFAVIGPKRATGEHLKTLARVSRLLRNKSFRDTLIASPDSKAAYDLIAHEEEGEKSDDLVGRRRSRPRTADMAYAGPEHGTEIGVGTMAEDAHLGIELRRVAGEAGLDRPVRHPRVQKCGLALAGHFHGVVPTRVPVLGETELSYLESMGGDARSTAARGFFSLGLSCVVITRPGDPPRALSQAAEATATPLFVSSERSSRTINAIHALLDDRLAPTTQLHGVLVDVYGIGLLLLGKSGIGKSECALELVLRGHRLVADDVVRCEWRPPGMIFGGPADLLRHHIEVRGLGVLNIKDLFGVTSVNERKRIDVVIRLTEWSEKDEYDRLGVGGQVHTILGQGIRLLTVPVRPGRDMGSMLEIAARNELLRRAGKDSARSFIERVEATMRATGIDRPVEPESVAGPVEDLLAVRPFTKPAADAKRGDDLAPHAGAPVARSAARRA